MEVVKCSLEENSLKITCLKALCRQIALGIVGRDCAVKSSQVYWTTKGQEASDMLRTW